MRYNIAASGENLENILSSLNATSPIRESRDGTKWFHCWLESDSNFREIQDLLGREKVSYLLSDEVGNRNHTKGFPQWIREATLRTSTTLTFQFDFKSSAICSSMKTRFERYFSNLVGGGLTRWEIWDCPETPGIRQISCKGQTQGEKVPTRSGKDIFRELVKLISTFAVEVHVHIWFDRSEEHA